MGWICLLQVPSNDKVQDNRQQRKKRRAADEEGDSDEEEDAPRGRGRRGQAEDADDAEKGDAGNLQGAVAAAHGDKLHT